MNSAMRRETYLKVAICAALCAVSLHGCKILSTYEAAEPYQKFPVSSGASRACVTAAAEASKWCAKDPRYRSETEDKRCTRTSFEYQAQCT